MTILSLGVMLGARPNTAPTFHDGKISHNPGLNVPTPIFFVCDWPKTGYPLLQEAGYQAARERPHNASEGPVSIESVTLTLESHHNSTFDVRHCYGDSEARFDKFLGGKSFNDWVSTIDRMVQARTIRLQELQESSNVRGIRRAPSIWTSIPGCKAQAPGCGFRLSVLGVLGHRAAGEDSTRWSSDSWRWVLHRMGSEAPTMA
ncbi:hypothetical protein GLOTRDRAFT_90406 [Gloeophyllum trabeum ATCC 11539]|uniref:Uncharacterized protein n=1 Tax=Gloeophyllum trabeum (strain ATCC 11539 / FP-39264 / Madison 617) TaxID=670483 RepID=S7QP94_GLOTA|nr:uncharacterized protein GLOTRDRAFT_90406 [Gloeophyllum trabeum ATCC 11539]EPQ61142.1 hypothetical protein GLOTRDRAFT_90406 [Gloeophyllum trabeum ATCC 11539]